MFYKLNNDIINTDSIIYLEKTIKDSKCLLRICFKFDLVKDYTFKTNEEAKNEVEKLSDLLLSLNNLERIESGLKKLEEVSYDNI